MSKVKFIHQLVHATIEKYGTRDPFEICRCMGIRIHHKDLGLTLKAFYFYQSRIKNIVINSSADQVLHPVLCAHELGHALLHEKPAMLRGFQELNLFGSLSPAEYEANLFAADLIIPDETLLELLHDPDKSIFTIANELYVPVELLDFKFRVLEAKGLAVKAPWLAQGNFLKDV